MKQFILFFLLGITPFLLPAQVNIVDIEDGIPVDINVNKEIIYIHTIKENHTLYSLSKLFKISVDELKRKNSITSGQTISLDSQIKIPLDPAHIIMSTKKMDDQWIPLIYHVKKRENLYKLSHVYFPQKIEYLVSRNNINGFALKENQPLIIGYWNPSNIEYAIVEEKKEVRPKFYFKKIPTQSGFYFEKIIRPQETEINVPMAVIDSSHLYDESMAIRTTKKGIAIWERSWTDDGNLYVLHNYAREKSMITLRNPVVGTEIQAQVIGSIPEGIYTEDVDIILNPAVAKRLGALDSRLRIEMDYYE